MNTLSSIQFTVIMPCYNSEAYLTNAVNSLLSQTYSNWELIAVNDGSTDRTLELLNSYAAQYPNIHVFSKPNGGYASAINYGLDHISGDYFLMMGSDDQLDSSLFMALYQGVCDQSTDEIPDCIAFRTLQIQDGNNLGNDLYTRFSSSAVMYHTTVAAFDQAYPKHSKILSIRDTSKCFKRSLLEDLRYFGKYGLDSDGIFSMLICHRAKSFLSVPVDGYLWTLRSDSVSAKVFTHPQNLDRVDSWTKFFDLITQQYSSEITDAEKNYANFFVQLIVKTWMDSDGNVSDYALIKNAIAALKLFSARCSVPLSLPVSYQLLFLSPHLWKVYIALRSILQKTKG